MMKNCPVCGSSDVKSDSNASILISTAGCRDCGFSFQAPVPEQDIEAMWNVIENFSEKDKKEMLDGPEELKCADCGRIEKEPYCDGDRCICGGILGPDHGTRVAGGIKRPFRCDGGAA